MVICPSYHNLLSWISVQHKNKRRTLVLFIMFADAAIELRDIVLKKFTSPVEGATQLELAHPVYWSTGPLVFDITCIKHDPNDLSRCFVSWKNTSIQDHPCWFPYDLETSENIDALETSFPDCCKKVSRILPMDSHSKKRSFDDMSVFNQELISQLHSLLYVYSHARSTMDQLHYIAIAILLRFIHYHSAEITTINVVEHMVKGIFVHDVVSRDFIMVVVTRFLHVKEKPAETHEVHKLLKTIHGVGDVRAAELVRLGIRNVDDLRNMLTRNHKIVPLHVSRVLPFHEDLQKRIPRSEVEHIASIVKTHGKALRSDLHTEVLGSYSRGALSCGDVDLLMTSPSIPSMSKDNYIERIRFLHSLVNSLKMNGVLVETMSMTQIPKSASPTVKGSVMFMGIVKVEHTCRHIDIKIFPHDLLPFCQLHFVGNYRFSKALRWYTKQKGYRLSELGLRPLITPGSEEDSETDLEDGDIVPRRAGRIKTERDIFYALRLNYVSPEQRQLV